MKTLKQGLKETESNDFQVIVKDYNQRDKVKFVLYIAEDVLHLSKNPESPQCVNLIKEWLKDGKRKELKIAASKINTGINNADRAIRAASHHVIYGAMSYLCDTIFYSTFPCEFREVRKEEYREYARLLAYEDLDFPYREQARSFDLDDSTDLNIFLDFLTDNYPDAITYPREEYFKNKLAKEYLKVIYQ